MTTETTYPSRLWIPGRLPGLNEIITASKAQGVRGRGGKGSYQDMKSHWGYIIGNHIDNCDFKVLGPHYSFLFVEPDKRRDPDNIVAGGHKIVLDVFQDKELIPNDGWKQVKSFNDDWIASPEEYGVLVIATNEEIEKHIPRWIWGEEILCG